MSDKYEYTRRLVEAMDRKVQAQRWIATAVVDEVRKKDRKVKVSILPDLVKTGWLRMYSLNAGDNYMSGVLPEKGSEVMLLFLGANPNSAVVLMGGILQPGDTADELAGDHDWIIGDKYGNRIIMQDGKVIIESENIELGKGATEQLLKGNAFQTFFNQHTVATPFGPSGPPIVPSTAAHLSSIVKTK